MTRDKRTIKDIVEALDCAYEDLDVWLDSYTQQGNRIDAMRVEAALIHLKKARTFGRLAAQRKVAGREMMNGR